MSKRKIILILVIVVLPFFLSAVWYSFFRYQKILHNTSCGQSAVPCAYEIVPPSLLELIINNSSTEMRPPCDPTATTTGCIQQLPLSDSPTPLSSDSPVTSLPIQSGKIDERLFIDLALRDVSFCGKMYKVKQVIIDGVDVVQRIAELATKNLIPKDFKGGSHIGEVVCQGVHSDNVQEILDVQVTAVPKKYSEEGNRLYTMNISGIDFVVNVTKNEMYLVEGFSGSSIGLVGLLK